MMKKFLSTLLIGAFVFGFGAVDVKVASAASPFKRPGYTQHRPGYSQYKPKLPRREQREHERNRHGGKTQRFR
ncbi:MAG: hypothetical protein IKE46_03445 [Selenomonadaceae bacterium]|nr:hypothetical protein [Selenomonadaceae bacterium]